METIKDLNSILAFNKVSELLSFSKAAKELGVSKAYISKLIQKLEDELGQKLLHRSTRFVKLTLIGEEFYETSKVAIESLEIVKSQLLESAQTPHGLLRISVAGAFGEEYITPIVAKLLKEYPLLKIELIFNEKIVNLVEENFDLAIRVGQLSDSNLLAKKIAHRKEFICGSKEYLHEYGTPKKIEDLKSHNCLLGNTDYWTFNEKNQVNSIKITSRFRSNNGRSLLNAALNGLGLCRLPEIYVKKYIDSGELIPVLENQMMMEIPIWAIYQTRKNQSINIRVFLNALSSSYSSDNNDLI